jgi:hypothetical protein
MFDIIVMMIWYFDADWHGFCVRYVDFRMSLTCYWDANALVFWGYTLWSLDIHSIWMVVQCGLRKELGFSLPRFVSCVYGFWGGIS